jgi:hypothetical protein
VVAAIAAIVAVIVINVTRPNIVGKYVFAATVDSEGKESTTTVDFMKAFGANYTIEFKNDKTGVIQISMNASYLNALSDDENDSDATNTTSTNFTYDDKKIKGTNESGEFESDYEFKDGAVILTIGDETMKFVKEQ